MKIFIASARRKAATMGLAAVTLAASIGAVCAEVCPVMSNFTAPPRPQIRKLSSHAGIALVSIVPGRAAAKVWGQVRCARKVLVTYPIDQDAFVWVVCRHRCAPRDKRIGRT